MKKILLISFLFIYGLGYSQDLTLGLQAYYPFNGNANDESGNNNNPVFNNATLTSDEFGNVNSAYHFNGVTTYMRILNSLTLNFNNTISLAAKVRPTGFYTGQCYNNMMVMKGDADYLSGNYSLRFSDVYTGCTTPTITEERFYGLSTIADTPIVHLNNWYDVVWTYDGTTAKIYVNCVLINSIVTSFSTFTNGYDLYIGKLNNPTYPFWLNGDLDEVRIYDRPLTQNEVNLYGDCALVPVTLTAFNTSVTDNKKISVNWNTEAELNLSNYTIERSETGSGDYVSIGTVPSNNNSRANKYTFTDNTAKPNILYYYRLVINDLDGTKKLSVTKTARIDNKNFYTLVYPNPNSGILKLNIYNTSTAKIKIENNLGQVIYLKETAGISSDPLLINISQAPKGNYWLMVETSSSRTIEKIIKQ